MNRLDAIEAREQAATEGPWYPKATDDALCMNARYVSLTPGEWANDQECGMAEPADYEHTVAITMLQYPRLACLDDAKWDENTEFIAHSRADIPLLLAVARAAVAWAVAREEAYRLGGDYGEIINTPTADRARLGMSEEGTWLAWRMATDRMDDAEDALLAAIAPLMQEVRG